MKNLLSPQSMSFRCTCKAICLLRQEFPKLLYAYSWWYIWTLSVVRGLVRKVLAYTMERIPFGRVLAPCLYGPHLILYGILEAQYTQESVSGC